MNVNMIASDRGLFDEYVGVSSSELSFQEIKDYRPKVYTLLSDEQAREEFPLFIKVHDAFGYTSCNHPVFPQSATKAVLYFIRNPLDIVGSFAHHMNSDYDSIITAMNDESYSLCGNTKKMMNQLEQPLYSWSNHVKSWSNSELSLLVLKYEEMLSNPIETFSKAIHFCGLNYSNPEIEIALKKCSFSELQKQESEIGFAERTMESKSFFRKGCAGGWKEELTTDQIRRIIDNHSEVMKQFGYLEN